MIFAMGIASDRGEVGVVNGVTAQRRESQSRLGLLELGEDGWSFLAFVASRTRETGCLTS